MSDRGTRRDYRHFPAEYADLVRKFHTTGRASIAPLTYKEARAATRDLYRWRMFLSAACDSDEDDPYARELFNMFSNVTLKIEPLATECEHGTHCVVFHINPVVRAVRAAQAQEPS